MLVLVHGIDNLRSKLSSMPSLGHLYVVCFHKTHGKVMLSHTIDVDFLKCYKCDTRKLSTKGTFSTGFFTCCIVSNFIVIPSSLATTPSSFVTNMWSLNFCCFSNLPFSKKDVELAGKISYTPFISYFYPPKQYFINMILFIFGLGFFRHAKHPWFFHLAKFFINKEQNIDSQ